MKSLFPIVLLSFLVLHLGCSSPQDNTYAGSTTLDSVPPETNSRVDTSAIPIVSDPSTEPNNFMEVGQAVSWALVNHDLKSLNTFIHPDTGLYFVHKPGAMPGANRVTTIAEIHEIFPFLDRLKKESQPDFTFLPEEEIPPTYDCGLMKFTKTGQFAGEKGACSYLSMVYEIPMEGTKQNHHRALACAKDLETYSREIVVTTPDGTGGWIFWLSQIGDNWWFTYWDIARMDCGA